MADRYLLTRPMERTEARIGRPLRDEIAERYGQGETTTEIGDALGVSASTVSRWMARLEIEARFPGQRKARVA
jgi:DNA-directed RNA polymerase specialized sigma24 family protein